VGVDSRWNLANPTNATIADGTGVGTILDNAAAPSLSSTTDSERERRDSDFHRDVSGASGADQRGLLDGQWNGGRGYYRRNGDTEFRRAWDDPRSPYRYR